MLQREPDWDALPGETSRLLTTFLRRCLEKNPKQRVRDIGDVRLAMEGAFETVVPHSAEAGAPRQLQVWQRPIPLVLAGLALVVFGGLAVWTLMRPASRPPTTRRRR